MEIGVRDKDKYTFTLSAMGDFQRTFTSNYIRFGRLKRLYSIVSYLCTITNYVCHKHDLFHSSILTARAVLTVTV